MPTGISPAAISRARRLRRGMTDGERRLWSELRQFRRWYGIHVRRQVPIGPYVADFAIHEHRLVIEVDGQHHFEPDQMHRDRERDAWLASQGYKVLRFNTGELSASFDGCVEEILEALGLMADTPTPTPSPQGGGGLPLIRPATPADFDACAKIINDYVDATDWLPRVHSREAVRGFFNDELLATRTVLVAENQGEIVAYMSFSSEGFVYAIYLDPEARGRGLGRALIDIVKEQHPERVELTVFEKNERALRFYEREGFREVPEGRDSTRPEGIDTLLMRWERAK